MLALLVGSAVALGLFVRADGRILPSMVNLSNVEAFKEQTKRDLPPGTPKAAVEAYLTRWKIRCSFVPPSGLFKRFANSYHCSLRDIGLRAIFWAWLSIWIHLDNDDKLREIKFDIRYK